MNRAELRSNVGASKYTRGVPEAIPQTERMNYSSGVTWISCWYLENFRFVAGSATPTQPSAERNSAIWLRIACGTLTFQLKRVLLDDTPFPRTERHIASPPHPVTFSRKCATQWLAIAPAQYAMRSHPNSFVLLVELGLRTIPLPRGYS